jgi:chaperone required for assembly of F1-ATPase
MSKEFDPLIDWYNEYFNIKLKIFTRFPDDSAQYEAKEAFSNYLDELKPYEVITLHSLIVVLESFITGFALFKGKIDIEKAYKVANLGVVIQKRRYGTVLGEQDITYAESIFRMSSALYFQAIYNL